MEDKNNFYDVIIIGGSNAGLSAGMALARALRKVLIIDSGKPCNAQTPQSHNFYTQDGKTPHEIASVARAQLLKYDTVKIIDDLATEAKKISGGFEINTLSAGRYTAKKVVFASGIKDIFPPIPGFDRCWGVSVIHCPYCHGYEYRNEKTGILANGDIAFEFSKLISNWTKDLTLYTNGPSTLNAEQTAMLQIHHIHIVEKELASVKHENGYIRELVFQDGSQTPIKALYAKLGFTQHTDMPVKLGCELNEQGYLQVDSMMKTTVPGIFACGDNTTPMRSIANAVYNGSIAGVASNLELVTESFT